jgi:hypothetical protein
MYINDVLRTILGIWLRDINLCLKNGINEHKYALLCAKMQGTPVQNTLERLHARSGSAQKSE